MVEVAVGNLTVHFPFAPYAVQEAYMRAVVTALRERQHALLESPTGTGKTLCLLCATIAWLLQQQQQQQQQHMQTSHAMTAADTSAALVLSSSSPLSHPRDGVTQQQQQQQQTPQYARRQSTRPSPLLRGACRVVYCSRTHAQLTQVIRELKRSAYGAHVSMALLASREYMCVNSEVTRLPSLQAQRSACNALRADRGCRYFRGLQAGNATQLDEAYLIHDMEDLVLQGRKCGFCPYYLERDAACDADVVFMPYNYVLDPQLRSQLPFALDECVLIIDEAHNLPSVLSAAGCLNLPPLELTNAIYDCARAMAALRLGRNTDNSSNSKGSNSGSSSGGGGSMDANDVAAMEQELASLKITLCRLEACIAAEPMTAPAHADSSSSSTAATMRKRVREVASSDGNNSKNKTTEAVQHESALLTIPGELVRPGAYMRTFLAKALITRAVYVGGGGGGSGLRGMSDAINSAVTLLADADSPAGGLVRVQQFLDEVFAEEEDGAQDEDGGGDGDGDDQTAPTRFVLQEQQQQQQQQQKSSASGAAVTPPRRVLGYWRLDNAPQLRALAARLRCMLLTSGTLSPLDHFAAELGVPFAVRLQGAHVVQPSRVLSCVLCKAPGGERLNGSYALRSSVDYRLGLGMTVVNLARQTPGGTLVFFASYHAMHAAVDLWQLGVGSEGAMSHNDNNTNNNNNSSSKTATTRTTVAASVRTVWGMLSEIKPIFVEPANSADLGTVVAAYQRTIDAQPRRGAVLLAVCRGKVSEGVDFADNHGRCVLVAGIPYANHTELFVRLKRAYYTAVAPHRPRVRGRLFSGDDWYRNEAMRAVNQCIGRIIRHAHDYGAMVLADERFASQVSSLSEWVGQRTVVHHSFRETHRAVAGFFALWSGGGSKNNNDGSSSGRCGDAAQQQQQHEACVGGDAAGQRSGCDVAVPASSAHARAYAAAQQQRASDEARQQQRERIAAALAQTPLRDASSPSSPSSLPSSGNVEAASAWPCAPVQRMTRQTLADVTAAAAAHDTHAPHDNTTAARAADTATAALAALPEDATSLQFSAYIKARLSAARYDDFRNVLKQLVACRAQLATASSSSSAAADAVRSTLCGVFAQLRALLREADAHAEAQLLRSFARHLPREFRVYYTRYVESLYLDAAPTS